MDPLQHQLSFSIRQQPTDTTCGPTCLQAVYGYYDDRLDLDQLIREIPELKAGGTLEVHLGIHALRRGYEALLYTFNLRIFDPTWFNPTVPDFRARLEKQARLRPNEKRREAATAFLEFLDLGGTIRLQDLNGSLLRRPIRQGWPILTGLSATFLYRNAREIPATNQPDDLLGDPCGHFVVLCGYDKAERKVIVADPFQDNPYSSGRLYPVPMDRLLNSILLGVLTYDANLLVIKPGKRTPPPHA